MELREAAQQALEAIDKALPHAPHHSAFDVLADCADDLRAALSTCKEGLQVEPVAWMVYTEGGTSAYVTDNPNDLVGAYRALALYTTPPQRKPLTEEEILSVLRLAPPEPSLWPHLKDEAVVGDVQKAVLAIARAIERAHGIK